MLIVDQSVCLTVEAEDTQETSEATGLTTYSNSELTVFTYISIFENLWMQTEMLQHDSTATHKQWQKK
jgi:hypothetical protein